jgi:hypothetical protein
VVFPQRSMFPPLTHLVAWAWSSQSLLCMLGRCWDQKECFQSMSQWTRQLSWHWIARVGWYHQGANPNKERIFDVSYGALCAFQVLPSYLRRQFKSAFPLKFEQVWKYENFCIFRFEWSKREKL